MDEIDQAENDTWIRCDKAHRCNGWVHPECFKDLNLEEVKTMQKFVCPMCLCSTKTFRPPTAFEIFRSETTSEPRDWNSLDDEQKRVYKKKEENAKMKRNFERETCCERIVKMIFHAKNKNVHRDWDDLTESEQKYYYRLAESCETNHHSATSERPRVAPGDTSKIVLRRRHCGVRF